MDFWLQISTNGGGSYSTVEEWNEGDEFENLIREFDAVTLSGPFSSNTRIRFRCDASGNSDWVYIDDVLLTGCSTAANPNPIQASAADEAANFDIDIDQPVDLLDDELLLYPNPTANTLTIEFNRLTAEDAKIVVFDLLGQIVLIENISGEMADYQRVKLDVSQLEAGQYFLQLVDGTERRTARFVRD